MSLQTTSRRAFDVVFGKNWTTRSRHLVLNDRHLKGNIVISWRFLANSFHLRSGCLSILEIDHAWKCPKNNAYLEMILRGLSSFSLARWASAFVEKIGVWPRLSTVYWFVRRFFTDNIVKGKINLSPFPLYFPAWEKQSTLLPSTIAF